ncbi:hypothetical protein C8A01DRAFT_37607 [Parachaetomium inaequale]|uniref:Uncharacterized protein n=1 Tax=Parachaetomium inaequale TaxID=2588326 RepID=A0AAN6PCM5_9PEZI|nr:hypothetical protein C8A01DRAFT_37607 [Parachaetomium inaequale]
MIRNGDIALDSPEAINMPYSISVAAMNVLRFAQVADTPDAPPRFTHKLETPKPDHYFGFHADDWFRAVWAIFFFQKRRRKPIDLPSGQYKLTKPLAICKVSSTDGNRMVKNELTDLSEEAALRKMNNYFATARAQMLTLPLNCDDNLVERLLRRADPKINYLTSLHCSPSLTSKRKESIRTQKARAAQLNELYAEILPLFLPVAEDIMATLRLRIPKATYSSVPAKDVRSFYVSLGDKTASYLENQESLVPAFAEVDKNEDKAAAYNKNMQLLKLAFVTGDLIDTLEVEDIDWEHTLVLLGTNMATVIKAREFT